MAPPTLDESEYLKLKCLCLICTLLINVSRESDENKQKSKDLIKLLIDNDDDFYKSLILL